MKYSIIVAINSLTGIGCNNQIPWKEKEDLKFFKTQTENKVVIMGRKTFESLNYKPLKNRTNIVLSSTLKINDPPPNLYIYHSLYEFELYWKDQVENAFIIGGESLYCYVLANRIKFIEQVIVSRINNDDVCDTFFPMDIVKSNFVLSGVKNITSNVTVEFFKSLN